MKKISIITLFILFIFGLNANAQKKTFTETVNGVSFKMIYVEGGTFTMGATDNLYWRGDLNYELPTHDVTLSDYYIGETEVSEELWNAVMGDSMHNTETKYHPKSQISWNDAQKFCKKLSNLTGKNYCLPTEAQWEFAARGGVKSEKNIYSGSNENYNVNLVNYSFQENVKSSISNELGIYDMSGSVMEWCYDWFGNYNNNSEIDPIGPRNGLCRVLRGGFMGSFLEDPSHVSYRSYHSEEYNIASRNVVYVGFRIAICNDDLYSKMIKAISIDNIKYETIPLQKKSFTETINGVKFNMIYVEGGTFNMGAQNKNKNLPNYDSNAFENESPVHKVTLSDFYICETEVSQALWIAVMNDNYAWKKGYGLPVDFITYDDAKEFCCRLRKITGRNYCLPTEAQWEFAARGGKKNNKYTIYSGKNEKIANELGLYDMIGGVAEWCEDVGKYPHKIQINPKRVGNSGILRGGGDGDMNSDVVCRISSRGNGSFYPIYSAWFSVCPTGFRIALIPEDVNSERDGYEWVSFKGESNLCGAQAGGKVIVPAEYVNVKYMPYYGGYFLVGDGNYCGIYDCAGNYLIPVARGYSSIVKTCSDGRRYYRVCKDGKYGACDEIFGSEIIDPIYDDLILYNGIFYYKDGENWVALEYGLNTDHKLIIVDKEEVSQSALINYDIVLEQNKLEEAFGKEVVVEQVVTGDGNRAFKMIFENKILFDFGKSNLNAQAIKYIEQVAEALKKLPSTNVIIKGYTDNVGSFESNKRVSNNRAKAVSDRLALLGIARTRLSAQGVPLADYVATNETEEGRALNRRVEIVIELMK